ncbi:MAG: site-specific integrase [Lachnospiraceae bacterium]|nr:site-specific integrase [Lachnospiraceae bacterium]
MARPRKRGKKAKGIQSKKGYLYIILSETVIENGVKRSRPKWISTGLIDTEENVKKAVEARAKMLNNDTSRSIDRNIPLAAYTDLFLAQKKREVAMTTYSSYFYRAKRITDYFGSKIRVCDISVHMVERFLDHLLIPDDQTQCLTATTVRDIRTLLINLMSQAIKDGLISDNPAKEARLSKDLMVKYASVKHPEEEFFSYEEAQIFLQKVKDHKLYEFFYVTLFFGLRREEILGLRWSAINRSKKTMSINHTVTKGLTVLRANATKTACSAREYPLTDEQLAMFDTLKQKEDMHRQLCGNAYHENEYIFKNADGTPFYPDYPSKAFRKIVKAIPELPQSITFRGLRKSCVSILVHQGMDIKSIQQWVGHADINTTLKIYTRVKDQQAKKEISETMTDIIALKKY